MRLRAWDNPEVAAPRPGDKAEVDHDIGLCIATRPFAGIPVYSIVNLPDRQVEVYTDPSGPTGSPKYRSKRYYRNGASVPVVIAGEELGQTAVSAILRG